MRRRWSLPRGLRLILIAVVAWLLGTALFIPTLNPLLREWAFSQVEYQSLLSFGWGQTAMVQQELADYVARKHVWPEQLAEVNMVDVAGPFQLDISQPWVLRLEIGRHLPPESGLRGTRAVLQLNPADLQWVCRAGAPPIPDRWLRADCRAPGGWTLLEWMVTLLSACVAFLVAAGLWLWFHHPEISVLQRHPGRLFALPVDELSRIDRVMRWTGRRRALLRAARTDVEDWQGALGFARAAEHDRAQTLALRVAALCKISEGWSLPGRVFEWRLPQSFPLGLERCFVYLPLATMRGADVVRHLRGMQAAQDVLLVLSSSRDAEADLLRYAADPTNLCVLIDREVQTELLLSPRASEALVKQLVRQLKVTRISPYQTRGGVARPSAFFGREQVLARIVGREPGNYLVVGGRQLGKTSLLKAIERRLADHPRVQCRYVSLRDHRLAPRLALEFGLEAETSLAEVVIEIARRTKDRRLLLLIDEADPFVREDARSGYADLTTLRGLSEDGVCYFLLAGFWDVYEAAVLDYHSPLRNFGDVVQIGALETDACVRMATEPLARLGLHFAQRALVDRLLDASGRRANIVAILCQECIERLQPGERIIGTEVVDAALGSEAVTDALSGWSRLSPHAQSARLDRLAVYVTWRDGGTTLVSLLAELGKAGATIDAELVRRSLVRLQLAFVLSREDDRYTFAVPLSAAQFQASEVAALLTQELATLSSDIANADSNVRD